jgi:hypothetical protein
MPQGIDKGKKMDKLDTSDIPDTPRNARLKHAKIMAKVAPSTEDLHEPIAQEEF